MVIHLAKFIIINIQGEATPPFKENKMTKESRVDVMYVYERIQDILDCKDLDNMSYVASRFSDELAENYKVDTGRKIGQDLED